jgi:multisubunit Na+/H+ antiporter MnhE subunit
MAEIVTPPPARRRRDDLPPARRVASFLIWWALLMAFWVWTDDSVALPELLVGAVAAALGALLAEVVQYQADTHVRIRAEWVAPAFRLPVEIVRDLGVVLRALWRRLLCGEEPRSGFVEVPVRPGGDAVDDVTRRALIMVGTSVAPNTLVLGIERDREVMIVHHLVLPDVVSGGRRRHRRIRPRHRAEGA